MFGAYLLHVTQDYNFGSEFYGCIGGGKFNEDDYSLLA
jgi:hypothetical protein